MSLTDDEILRTLNFLGHPTTLLAGQKGDVSTTGEFSALAPTFGSNLGSSLGGSTLSGSRGPQGVGGSVDFGGGGLPDLNALTRGIKGSSSLLSQLSRILNKQQLTKFFEFGTPDLGTRGGSLTLSDRLRDLGVPEEDLGTRGPSTTLSDQLRSSQPPDNETLTTSPTPPPTAQAPPPPPPPPPPPSTSPTGGARSTNRTNVRTPPTGFENLVGNLSSTSLPTGSGFTLPIDIFAPGPTGIVTPASQGLGELVRSVGDPQLPDPVASQVQQLIQRGVPEASLLPAANVASSALRPSGPPLTDTFIPPNTSSLGSDPFAETPILSTGTILPTSEPTVPSGSIGLGNVLGGLNSAFGIAQGAQRGDPVGIAKSTVGLLQQVLPALNAEFGLGLPTIPTLADVANLIGGFGGETASLLSEGLGLAGQAAPVLGPIAGALFTALGGPDTQKEKTADEIKGLQETFPNVLRQVLEGTRLNANVNTPTDELLRQFNILQRSLSQTRQLQNAVSRSNTRENSLAFPDFSRFQTTERQAGRLNLQKLLRIQDILQSRGVTQPGDSAFRFSLNDVFNVRGLPSQQDQQTFEAGGEVQAQAPPPPRFLDPLGALSLSAIFGNTNLTPFLDPKKPSLQGTQSAELEGLTLPELIQRGLTVIPGQDAIATESGGSEEVAPSTGLGVIGATQRAFEVPNFLQKIIAKLSNVPSGGIEQALTPFGLF